MDEQANGRRLRPSGTEHGVQWQIGTNVSEEPSASILRTEDEVQISSECWYITSQQTAI